MVHLRHSRPFVIVVFCATLPSLASALPIVLDDAGTGTDAGDTRESALALAYGAYEGNLTVKDTDWYRFGDAATTLGCLDVTAMASTSMRFEIATEGTTVGGLADEGVFTTVLASAGRASFGVLSDEVPWSAASVGPYSFALAHSPPWATGDTVLNDAPEFAAFASRVPEKCFGASFRHDAPDVDVWTFGAGALDLVTYSFAVDSNAVGILDILGPGGDVIAGPIGSGDAGQFLAPTNGTYSVRTSSYSSSETSQYVVGLAVGPEPSTCRPYCLGLT